MYLASAIKPNHHVSVLEPDKEDIDKKFKTIKPDVVVYSIRTGFHTHYIELNKKLKKKYNFISVFGGPHATFFPHIINEKGVDVVCIGEGEEAFAELLNILDKKKSITKVKNFWVKKDNKIYKNSLRPLIQNLDNLKFPDHSIFNKYKQIRDSRVKCFMASRGCPYNCTYCFNDCLRNLYSNQNYVRYRSVDNLIKEIKEVKEKYGKNFEIALFEDDTFNLKKEWLREFSQKFRKLGLKFVCNIRADIATEEDIRLLKEAGCCSVSFGLESGVPNIRKKILNRNMTNEQIISCSTWIRKYKITFNTENILAIPFTTLEDDLKTLELNMICKPDYATACIMQPYPGTKIHEISVKNNLFDKNNFDNITSYYKSSSLKITNKKERENLQRLFPLAILSPIIYNNIRHLIKLRLGFIYMIFYELHRIWFGLKWFPLKRGIKEYFSLFKRYFFRNYW